MYRTTAKIVLLLWACAIANVSCWGQSAEELANNPPGVWYEGQFFGYRGGRGGQQSSPCVTGGCDVDFGSFADESTSTIEGCVGGCDCTDSSAGCEWVECAPLVYGQAEYLLWWTRGVGIPSLATSSATGTPESNAGVLGLASTTTLFGGELHDDMASGGRLTLGSWLSGSQESALEGTFLFLGEQSDSFLASQAQFPILARPFFNVQLGVDDARLIAFPGRIRGTLSVDATSEFQSMSLAFRRVMQRTAHTRWDLLAGYRFMHLEDRIAIRESTVALSGPEAGAARLLSDRFASEASFHGCELGVNVLRPIGPQWSIDASARVALGATAKSARVAGETSVTSGGVTATTSGGLLTQASNLGGSSESDFGAVSEFGLTLQRRIHRNASILFGYSFLLWSDVWRAGDQIDLSVNPTQIPPGTLVGTARPAFPSQESLFWAQGLRLGFEATY